MLAPFRYIEGDWKWCQECQGDRASGAVARRPVATAIPQHRAAQRKIVATQIFMVNC